MIGPLIGALVSAGGLGLQMGAQNDQNAINWRAVMETIRANREQEQLAKASREDVYGNKVNYREGGGFEMDLTPITEAILGNEQRERLFSLSKDAPRNRAAAERMDTRSQMADDEFKDVFNDYKFRPQRNEGEYIADAGTLLRGARDRGEAESANLIAKQLLRQGNTSNVGAIYKKASDNSAATLAETLINAKRIGREDYRSAENFDQQKYGNELGMLKGIADQTTTSPVVPNDFNASLSGRSDQALAQLMQALSQGNSQLTSALQTAGQNFGQSPDLSGIASALSKLDFSSAQGPQQSGRGPLDMDGTGYKVDDPWNGLRTTTI